MLFGVAVVFPVVITFGVDVRPSGGNVASWSNNCYIDSMRYFWRFAYDPFSLPMDPYKLVVCALQESYLPTELRQFHYHHCPSVASISGRQG